MPGRRLAPALALALLLGACTSGGGDDPDGRDDAADPDVSDAAQAAEDAAIERTIAERLTEDGAVPLDLGLDLFAAGYGPIDGGDPDAIPGTRVSGHLAMVGLVAHWDDLTPAQQATVTESLGLDDAVPVTLAGAGAGGGSASGAGVRTARPLGSSADEVIPGVTAALRRATDLVGARLGRTLGVPVSIALGTVPEESTWGAVTTPLVGGVPVRAGRMETCHIALYTLRSSAVTPALESGLVHEVFHCFQYDAMDVAEVYDGPSWAVEGGAEYVQEILDPSSALVPEWEAWLTEPGLPLTRRTYAGIGAFAVAAQRGVDVWPLLISLLEHPNHQAIERLFGTSADEALTAIAQALVREPGLGPAWESVGPSLPSGVRGTTVRDLPQGVTAELELRIRPYATAPHAVAFTGEVLDVRVAGAIGAIGLPGGTTTQITDGFIGRWCVTGFCECAGGIRMGATEIPSDGVVGIGLASTGAALLESTPPGSLRVASLTTAEACADPLAGPVMVMRFHEPEAFEVHGGHCLVQDDGALLIQAGGRRYPEGYVPPAEHRDDVEIWIYANPASPPDHGSVSLRIGGAPVDHRGSHVVVSPDHLSGTFAFGSGHTGDWVCTELITPDELFS